MRIFSFCILLFCAACTSSSTTHSKDGGTNQIVQNSEQVQFAKHFLFAMDKGEKVLQIVHPDSKKVIMTLKPFGNNQDVIALSGTFIGMLEHLKLASKIVGISELKYVYNPTVLANYKTGKVLECGYDNQMKLELMIAKKPAAIFHSGYHQEFSHQQQFEQVGIQCIPVYDWREESPLGKAEWIKVYGFLFGTFDEANAQFNAIVKDYEAIKNEARALSPSKLVMSGNIIGSEWCAPAGESFLAQIMKDANINYTDANSEGTGSVMSTIENMVLKNRSAVYWINPGQKSLKDLKQQNPKAPLFDAFKTKQVYCYSHNDNYYWEESSVLPHKLLSDLIQIAHPEFKSQSALHFYKRLN